MKANILGQINSAFLTTILAFGIACSTIESQGPVETLGNNQKEANPEVALLYDGNRESYMMQRDRMERRMNMDQMMGMMQDCMSRHNDDQICHRLTLDKCQMNMHKQECMDIIEEAKEEMKIMSKKAN